MLSKVIVMAKRKKPTPPTPPALDDLLEEYVPPQNRTGYLAKVSDEVLEFITRAVTRFESGELRDKFPNYSKLGEWLHETLSQVRPDGFPKITVKYFTEVIKTLKKNDVG